MRREIERGLRGGEVRAVVATNALELGIDIGGMGASILSGYPGTIAATWQQAGRAGRGSDASLAVLVATANPLDQFLAKHPDYFFDRSPEQALINPDNLLILLAHLRCAVFELPFRSGEAFGKVSAEQLSEFLEFLYEEGQIHRSGDKYFWMSDRYPAESISLRSASPQRVLLQIPDEDTWITIGEVDTESATWMVHPEAIYMHEAQTYLVESLDLDLHQARMRPVDVDYYTEPRSEMTVQLLEIYEEAKIPGGIKTLGEINVTTQTIGFRRIRWFTHEQLGIGDLTLPPTELQTTGYWTALSEETVASLRERGLWTNDPNQYGPNWEVQKAQVRSRDGYRCQVCGIAEEGRAHDVHHKIPFRTFSSYEQANLLHNLVTLCPACHRRVETAVRMRSGLSGVSYAIENLAPFFLMCDTRDLGVHSDPSSPLAEGRPAIVIFDRVPAGIGFSQRLFEIHAELIRQAYELVFRCECTDGCPSCVGPAGENGVGGKQEALALLSELIS
jgi:DEAD/DEAH box helicase domain-containing protein